MSSDMIFFFSRRIGLSDDGQPIPIFGGTRITGRAANWELGALNMQQREFEDNRATNFTVARLRRNILANSDIGVMMTNKEVEGPHYNRVFGADANFRFGQAVSFNGYAAKSFSPDEGKDTKNWASNLGFNYRDGTYTADVTYTDIQENFTNEMGFVPRNVGYQRGQYEAVDPPNLPADCRHAVVLLRRDLRATCSEPNSTSGGADWCYFSSCSIQCRIQPHTASVSTTFDATCGMRPRPSLRHAVMDQRAARGRRARAGADRRGRTCPGPAWCRRCRSPSDGSVASSWNSALPPPHLRWQCEQLACRYDRARASSDLRCRRGSRPAAAASPAAAAAACVNMPRCSSVRSWLAITPP